jgi:hypothetical protein
MECVPVATAPYLLTSSPATRQPETLQKPLIGIVFMQVSRRFPHCSEIAVPCVGGQSDVLSMLAHGCRNGIVCTDRHHQELSPN